MTQQSSVYEQLVIARDLEFGKGGGQPLLLHLLRPRNRAPNVLLPAIVFIHGGWWFRGSKDSAVTADAFPNDDIAKLAVTDYVVASVDYRLVDEAPFPAALEDCKCAVRFLRANAARFGLLGDRIGVWGRSAGGHLAAMVGLTADRPELEGTGGWQGTSSAVQAVVDWFGIHDLAALPNEGFGGNIPTDGPWLSAEMIATRFVGATSRDEALLRRASPTTYVASTTPPFLIMAGDSDKTVPNEQSQFLHDALQTAGAKSELQIVAGKGHEYLGAEAGERVRAFFDATLRA